MNLVWATAALAVLLSVRTTRAQAPNGTTGAVDLGEIRMCAHGFMGKVKALSQFEVQISELQYDGLGPGARWHIQMLQSSEVSVKDTEYMTLREPTQDCGVLKEYKNANITLQLPVPLGSVKSIGIMCYKGCNSFGLLKIDSKKVPTVGTPTTATACAKSDLKEFNDECLKGVKNSNFDKCDSKEDGGSGGEDGANGLAVISGMFLLPAAVLVLNKF